MEELELTCPYCAEVITVLVDQSVAEQEYYEDCSVCCCPILFTILIDENNEIEYKANRDDD